MELHIHGRNMEITNRTREHVEGKLAQIDRHLPGISDATMELAFEDTRSLDDQIVAQVTVRVGRTMLRAQQRAANAKAAVNAVAKALDQQIKRFKRHTYRGERGRSATRGAPEEIETFYPNTVESTESASDGAMVTDAAFPDGQVVRLKEFNMEPTSVNDAAAQMQFLGHDFFMFLDSESDKHSVLYLRGDGNYGMIQPK